MITTTLNRIRSHGPCAEGWRKLLAHLGKTQADDEPLPFATILESNGIDDALWCCRAEPQHDREWRLFAAWCARQVLTTKSDPRSRAAVDFAERFAAGEASAEELSAAESAAWSAAESAESAARSAAESAAWSAAESAARSAWSAAESAAWSAAESAAWFAARSAQAAEFLRIVS